MESQESDLIFVLLSGSLISLFLTVSVVLFVFFYQRRVMRQRLRLQVIESEHQVELMRSMLETQENERQRIAKDLHDDIGAVLSAAKMNLDLLVRRARKDTLEPDQLKEVGQVVSGAIGDLRRISHDLMPPALQTDGLLVALQVFLHKIEQNTEIRSVVESPGALPELPRERSLSIYRVVTELTNNSIKHSGCKEIRCSLQASGQSLQVHYQDNGKGFVVDTARKAKTSLGLKSLESRIGALKGNLEVISQPGHGMQAIINIPIETT